MSRSVNGSRPQLFLTFKPTPFQARSPPPTAPWTTTSSLPPLQRRLSRPGRLLPSTSSPAWTRRERQRAITPVSKHLQSDGLTLLDARVLFDELIKSHPSFTKYLAADADIVHSTVFEQAVVKVLDDQASLLTDGEVSALDPFKRTQAAGGGTERAPADKEGFAVRTLKRRKTADAPATYVLLEAIPPTSNIVERLFSVARAVLRHERHRISPMMLEMILFLKINSSRWDVATVEQCL
ncbi:hypothetical protein F441_20426 [Phytophthora nicotianae CJ01A1]|uniref:HAT C-terminal dimerisation domain-containing protein n=2 Tax=Phytophthora nicotianae TaxID=4792 RepID=W2Y6W0_PHYNI|nr:hypothetical protein F441_20426 [Phytophthora nicotianae CJ01A1]ETP30701.1 hypothetical protein F442_20356 [Phytophthora nicotianae P10297]